MTDVEEDRRLRGSEALLAFDREHVWHPYAALPAALSPLPVASARDVLLRLADGRELIDGMSSWWCAIHGYRHPALDRAVSEQLARMAHVMFGGLTHEPAVRLAQRLLQLAPVPLDVVFFADSGSVAVEVAIKMCLQFQRARGHDGRTRLLTIRGGYHGDTFGAMALCDPVAGMHHLFTGVLPEHVFAERPPDGFQAPLIVSRRVRPSRPRARWNWRHILIATSTATDPESAKNTPSSGSGASCSSRSARSTAGSWVRPPNITWAILPSCSLTARSSAGWR